MFITREAALQKLNSPDNPFSPTKRGSKDWGRVVEVDESVSSDSGSSSSDNNPSSAPVPDSPDADEMRSSPSPSAAEIRNILNQVNPAVARDRSQNLRGRTDVQAAIGQTSLIVGPRVAGSLFDRSVPQTSAYEGGHGRWRDSVGAEKREPKPELVEKLSAFKEKLAYAAGRVLETSLDNLDEEKIKRMKKATSISKVAKDMAVIMDKVSKSDGNEQSVHFHIYRPDMRSVNAYETVKINGGTTVSAQGGLIDVLPPEPGSETNGDDGDSGVSSTV